MNEIVESVTGGQATPSRALLKLVERAVLVFGLIRPGDRVAVGISGGKDSILLWQVLRELQRRTDLPFELGAVHLDQHQPRFERDAFNALMARFEVPLQVVSEDTWSVVESKLKPGQIPCALCGRMRRGILNRWCAENGYTKLALGHHLDDAVETFFLNLFFQRRLDPLKAATPSDSHGVVTIRPLILVEERKVIAWRDHYDVGVVACPVCDTFPDSQRREMGELLNRMREVHPQLDESVREAIYGDGALLAMPSQAPHG